MAENRKAATEIGQRIYTRRKQLGMTQEQLCEMAGTTPQAISNYERGERELKASAVVKIQNCRGTARQLRLAADRARHRRCAGRLCRPFAGKEKNRRRHFEPLRPAGPIKRASLYGCSETVEKAG